MLLRFLERRHEGDRERRNYRKLRERKYDLCMYLLREGAIPKVLSDISKAGGRKREKEEKRGKERERDHSGVRPFSILDLIDRCYSSSYTSFIYRRPFSHFPFCSTVVRIRGKAGRNKGNHIRALANTAVAPCIRT